MTITKEQRQEIIDEFIEEHLSNCEGNGAYQAFSEACQKFGFGDNWLDPVEGYLEEHADALKALQGHMIYQLAKAPDDFIEGLTVPLL